MSQFTDLAGHVWPLVITHGDWKRVKSALGVDLYRLLEKKGEQYTKLMDDRELFMNVVYQLLKPEIDKAGLTQEQFELGIGGEEMSAAGDAFDEAFANFTRDRTQRKAMGRVILKKKEAQARMEKRALEETDKFLDRGILQAEATLEAELRNGFTAALASSASSPTPSPSES